MSEEYKEQKNSDMSMNQGMSPSKAPWIILLVVVVILAAVGIMFRERLFMGNNPVSVGDNMSMTKEEKASGYQAVFLTNGQVYFGKMSRVNDNFVVLKDIYYLQVTQPPLQGSQNQQQAGQTPQLSLVKLGNELHGPVDAMSVSRQQILFYEDMKENGRVMEAIREYQKNPNNQQPAGNQQQAPSQQQGQNQQAPAANK